MRPKYDDFDDFGLDLDFEFADSTRGRQMLREIHREQRRLASRRALGPGSKRADDDSYDDYESYEDVSYYEEYEDYDDYDDDEFDSYSEERMH